MSAWPLMAATNSGGKPCSFLQLIGFVWLNFLCSSSTPLRLACA